MPRIKTSREELLRVAARIFARKGYSAASVTDIQQAARIGRGTFYLYFKSKRDIFAALLERMYSTLDLVLSLPEAAIAEIFRQNIRTGEFKLLTLNLKNLGENRDVLRLLLREAAVADPAFRRQFDDYMERLIDHLAGALQALIDSGDLRTFDPRITAVLFIGAFKEILDRLVAEGRIDDPLKFARRLANILLHGFAGPRFREVFFDEDGVHRVEKPGEDHKG